MSSVDKSVKLLFNEFQRSIAEVPLEVYYQNLTSEQYNSSGFYFNVKQPGSHALLDPDIWIHYLIKIQETGVNSVVGYLESTEYNRNDGTNPDIGNGALTQYPPFAVGGGTNLGQVTLYNLPNVPYSYGLDLSTNLATAGGGGSDWDSKYLAFRGGNFVARSLQNLSVQINNRTLNVVPYKFLDVLNRIYISADQSEHEFSASGGRFDEGNHGKRTLQNCKFMERATNTYNATVANDAATQIFSNSRVPSTFGPAGGGTGALTTNVANVFHNSSIEFNLSLGYGPCRLKSWGMEYSAGAPNNILGAAQASYRKLFMNIYPDFPIFYEYYNPGFDKRVSQFISKLRYMNAEIYNQSDFDNYYDITIGCGTVYNPGVVDIPERGIDVQQYAINCGGTDNKGIQHVFQFHIYERLPIPLFKMYSNDEVFGVIPNVKQMIIQGNFIANKLQHWCCSNSDIIGVQDYWVDQNQGNCNLYLRWFTPPMSMAIPREIHYPYKKIVVWSKTYTASASTYANSAQGYVTGSINEYNITLEAIPDLLLIYVKYATQNTSFSLTTPDDCNWQINALTINIDNASGKLNQMTTIDLYHKWKKLMKHSDSKIMGYDEWRRYCCVAALQPEDYGVRYGPGYSNQTVLGVVMTISNWNINPSIMYAQVEPLGGFSGGITGNGVDYELEIVSIFNRNWLTIRDDGTCSEELLKVSADFNLGAPAITGSSAPAEGAIRGRLMI